MQHSYFSLVKSHAPAVCNCCAKPWVSKMKRHLKRGMFGSSNGKTAVVYHDATGKRRVKGGPTLKIGQVYPIRFGRAVLIFAKHITAARVPWRCVWISVVAVDNTLTLGFNTVASIIKVQRHFCKDAIRLEKAPVPLLDYSSDAWDDAE
jgi:hypothetical protein